MRRLGFFRGIGDIELGLGSHLLLECHDRCRESVDKFLLGYHRITELLQRSLLVRKADLQIDEARFDCLHNSLIQRTRIQSAV